MLTGAASSCQHALCTQVVEAGGNDRLIAKARHPTLLADRARVFAPLTAAARARTGVHTVLSLPIQTYRTIEKGHGRLAARPIRVSSELAEYRSWPSLVQVVEYTRRWTSQAVTKHQGRAGISSLPASVSDAASRAAHKRGHWPVENGLHAVKAVPRGEAMRPTHVGNGADGMASVRNMAMRLLPRAGQRAIATCLRRARAGSHAALALIGIPGDQNA